MSEMTGATSMIVGPGPPGEPEAGAGGIPARQRGGLWALGKRCWGLWKRWWSGFPRWWELGICLLVLTGIGAFFRFWRLDFQAYWTDEAYTLPRISRTFDYMLQQLTS